MQEHPNVALFRQAYAAFAAGDLAWLGAHLAEDVVWHSPGHGPASGESAGKAEVLRYFARLSQATGGTLRLVVHDVVGNDRHVVGIVYFSAEGPDGETFEARAVNVFHVDQDKATEVWVFNENQDRADVFFMKLPW